MEKIIEKAREAQALWKEYTFEERSEKILHVADYIVNNIDHAVSIIVEETGKPRFEALSADLVPVVHLIHYYCENAKNILKPKTISLKWLKNRTSEIVYHPHGVIGIISPWNFPYSIPTGETLTALMAGNAVILKPSEVTPRISQLIEASIEAADLPPGLFQIIYGEAKEGKALVESDVDKIVFTGSVPTGKWIAEECAKRLKPCSLELGGKDAMIVLADADLNRTVKGATWGSLTNSGQVCASVERILVHENIYEAFLSKIKSEVDSLRLEKSSPHEDNTDLGRIISSKQKAVYDKQLAQLEKIQKKCLTGGHYSEDGNSLLPTIVECNGTEEIWNEETFGPVIAVMPFSSEEQAISIANNSKFGLTASVWSKNYSKAKSIAKKIEAHTVMINTCVYTHALAETPWGGFKESGLGGSVHGESGLLAMVKAQHLHYDRFATTLVNDPWWFPYTTQKFQVLKDSLQFMHARGLEKISAIGGIVKGLWKR